MLQLIRDRLTGWVALIIIILIGLAFALWGIDLGGANLNYAAKVNGEDISLNDFRRQQQNQLSQYAQFYSEGVPPEVEDRLRQNLLEGMIRQELVGQRSEKLGYRVGDLAVAGAIQDIAAFKADDEFSMDLYQGRLMAQGLSPAGFEARMRESLRNAQLQTGVTGSGFVTQGELARYVALQDQQREVSWVVIEAAPFIDTVEVADEAIRAEYEANPDAYQSPETVAIEYLMLPRDVGAASVSVSEQELQAYFEQERSVGRFGGSEERRVRHILISVDDDTDDEAARAEAEGLFDRINGGEDFAALAAEHSDDPGSKTQGGDLGWAEPDIYVPPFREAILNMQPGEVSGPVRTQFGYHVIRLEEVRDQSDKPFAEVRDELLAELRASRAEEIFYDRAAELRDLAFKAFNELGTVAEDLELQLETLAGITRDSGPGIASAREVREVAFSDPVLLDSENSDTIELPEGVMVLRVTEHQPSSLLPLAQVREQIANELARQQAEAMAAEQGRELAEKSRLGGKLEAEALPANARFNEPRFVGRSEAGLGRDLLTAIFAAPRPAATPAIDGLRLSNGDYAVYAVHAIKPGDLNALNETERAERRRQFANLSGNLELAAYIDKLRRAAKIRVNEEQLN